MSSSPLELSGLEPIGLDALTSSAALLTRKDRKYIVPLALAQQLATQAGLRVLEIDGRRSFSYESVYFDTPQRTSYFAAAHKRRRRFKVRTRSYLDSGICSLEVKTRERRGLTEKHRLAYDVARRDQLTGDALEFVDRFERIAPISRRLRATLITRYDRTTMLETSSLSRTTVDTNLRWEDIGGSTISLPGIAIVETTSPPGELR